MSPSAWILAILIPGILWGGFITCLVIAMRKESGRSDS